MHTKTKIHGKALIINSRAPDMSNAVGARKEYWGRAKKTPQIGREDIVILAADNNGKVSKKLKIETKQEGNGQHPKKISHEAEKNYCVGPVLH